MKKILQIFAGVVLVAGVAGFAAAMLPWKGMVASKLQAALEEKGFENVHLSFSKIGLHGATVEALSLGRAESPLFLKDIVIHYSPRELWDRNLQALTLSGVSLEIRRAGGKWDIQGFGGSGTAAGGFKIPVSRDELSVIPVDRLTLDKSILTIVSDQWRVAAPVTLEWQKTPDPKISLRAENLELNAGNLSARAGEGLAEVKLAPSGGEWEGPWALRDVRIKKGSTEFPAMKGAGTLKAGADSIFVNGELKSPDEEYRAAFLLEHKYKAPKKSELTLTRFDMPWRGGKLAADNIKISLLGDDPVRMVLQVHRVSINELMEAMTGKRVSATGLVSGDLPLTIRKDGSISVGKGILQAAGPGVISMPPEIIPGDSEQAVISREILKNFHYQGLSVEVSGEGEDGLLLLVALEGNNPDVYEGRPVKLNVRLTGDVLDFIRQNVMFITDPKTLLNRDEK